MRAIDLAGGRSDSSKLTNEWNPNDDADDSRAALDRSGKTTTL